MVESPAVDPSYEMLRVISSFLWNEDVPWTLKKIDIKKIEAFEMWMYRRMLRTLWTDRTTNNEMLRRVQKEKEVILTVN